MTTTDYSKALDKKMKLLSYFKRYMTEHLVKAGANNVNFESDQISRMPHLHSWFRTTCAVVMHLTNGTVQVSLKLHYIPIQKQEYRLGCVVFKVPARQISKEILCPLTVA